MKILIGTTQLDVINIFAERDITNNKLYLKVDVAYSTIDYTVLKKLFKENTEDIKQMNEDGITIDNIYSGFIYQEPKDFEEEEYYRIILLGEEDIYQNKRLKNLVNNLENTVASKKAIIAQKESELVAKDEEIITYASEYTELVFQYSMLEIEIQEIKDNKERIVENDIKSEEVIIEKNQEAE